MPAETPAAELLDMNQAIELLKTTRPTFYRWLRAGRISGHKVGRQWRFERADIERFLRGEEPRIALRADIEPLLGSLRSHLGDVGASDAESGVDQAVSLLLRAAQRPGFEAAHLEPGLGPDAAAVLRFRGERGMETIATIDSRLMPPLMVQLRRTFSCPSPDDEPIAEGQLEIATEGRAVILDAAFLPGRHGESLTVLARNPDMVRGLDEIPFEPEDHERLRRFAKNPHGLLVLSGPTGSGKTTVLYACILEVAGPESKVLSLEEPVEHPLPWTTQIPVNAEGGPSFDRAFRAAMRSDPDALVLDSLNQGDRMRAAHRAVLEGHRVLATLHASDTGRAVSRMIDRLGDPLGFADLRGLVVSQRLVRRLCKQCRVRHRLSSAESTLARRLVESGNLPWKELERSFRKPRGCDHCQQRGYRGRAAIFEMLELSRPVCDVIRRGAGHEEIRSVAVAEGMTTLEAAGVREAGRGTTSLEEVGRAFGLTGSVSA